MKKEKVIYKDDAGEMKDFDGLTPMTREEELAAGIPAPGKVRLIRKTPKETRINIRIAEDTLEGLKARAEEWGLPYQTLAASLLHLVATGKLKLSFVQ